jgi:hypothetical protein
MKRDKTVNKQLLYIFINLNSWKYNSLKHIKKALSILWLSLMHIKTPNFNKKN